MKVWFQPLYLSGIRLFDSPSMTHPAGGGGNIACFGPTDLDAALNECCNNPLCAGFSYDADPSQKSGCYKTNTNVSEQTDRRHMFLFKGLTLCKHFVSTSALLSWVVLTLEFVVVKPDPFAASRIYSTPPYLQCGFVSNSAYEGFYKPNFSPPVCGPLDISVNFALLGFTGNVKVR